MSDEARRVRRILWVVMASMVISAAMAVDRGEWFGAAGFVFAMIALGSAARLVRCIDETRDILRRVIADRDAIIRARPTPTGRAEG